MSVLLKTRTDHLTPAEARRRAAALVADLRGRAAETERLGQLPPANVEALREAGLFRLAQARRCGGHQLPLRAQVDVVAEVARGCASTAWCLGVAHAHSWLAALFPEAAQDDVYATDPDALLAAVVTPRGQARSVRDGYVLSGLWPFCSGCHHSDWVLLAAAVHDEAGGPTDQGLLLLPASDVTIKDDWNVMALRGTGSCSVAVKDCFVPRHRYLSYAALAAGQAPGREVHDGWLYRAPAGPVLMLALAPAALGAAEGALDDFKERLPGRKVAYTAGELQGEMPITHLQVAEAAAKIDVARLLLYHCADELRAVAERGAAPDVVTRARFHRDCACAVRQCLEAVEILFLACGGSGIADGNPVQRAARDIHAMSMHGAFNLPLNLESYGRTLLGLPPRMPML
jgi:3-hydroxy-9,10-secoandrosta-1,3,5(10)-triene-9,17-dione monooxygenase